MAQAQSSVAFEVDDSDSGYEDNDETDDLTTISSSIYNYTYENGRTYHAYRSGSYVLPNDEKEQSRLDILHHTFRLCLGGGLCRTKLDDPQRIIDIGTGTGRWAVQMAEEFPAAEVIGVDLSPIQPGWVTPNLHFVVDDVRQEWPYPPNSFDFIHVRCLAGSLTNWPEFLQRCYKHLKPGGKIELSEGRTHIKCNDGTYPQDSHTYMWIAEFHRIARANGLEFDPFPQYKDLLTDANFDKVETHEEVCPIGTWPKNKRLKEMGRYFRAQFLWGAVDGYSMALFTRYGGWSAMEMEVLLARVRQEIKSNKMHVYIHCAFATAQKPVE